MLITSVPKDKCILTSLDFESTCDIKAKSGVKAEIIKAQTGEIVDEFHKYVRPTENPILSDFCKKLTGISQERVDGSSDLQQVLKEFEQWLKNKKKQLNCTFKVDCQNSAIFVTWTDWDIRTCLWNECQRKRLSLPVDLLTRIDLKAVFKQWHASKNPHATSEFQGRLQDAITAAGLSFRGRPHSGIDDARNTAALLYRIISGEVESDKKLYPSKSNLNDLGRLYQKSFETLLDSTVKGPILRSNNLEIFVSDAFKLVMHFCGTYEKVTLKELAFDELVPKLQSDPTLHKRLTLGYASFLAQFLNLLPEIDCVLIDSDLHRLQKFVQNLLFVSGQIPDRFSHTDLISWNIDRGLCVKDYALTFLRNSNFDDALCSSKVLVRLNRQLPLLTEDSDVTMAVIRKLNYLRSKMLPVNSHEDLLKELMSVLSPALKTEILDRLHNKSKKPITPLPLEENKFRSYLRNFFNRLSVGPVLSDNQPVSKMCKLWRDNASSNTVSKEVLLSADMLVLTQPLKFLSELVRFPIIQNSMALLPVLYNILNHVSYAFTINIDDNQASILHNLMVSLLEMYDSETPETREGDDGLIWRGANRQRMELMRYLPRSGDLDPEQISLANQAAKFSTSSASGSVCFDLADDDDVNNNKGGGGGEDSMGKSAVRKLWVYAITCFLDQPATWPHLSELVNDESSVLSSRKRAELFTQCLALILLPRPPANIPLDLVAPPCLRLLENLRSPLAVRLCATLLPSTSGVTEALRNVFTDPGDQGRRLFLQSIDCLPVNLVENMIISLPQCLTQSNLVDVNILNKSPKNIYKFFFESQTSTSQPSFAKPISASDFEEVLQLVSLCDSVWNIVVNHILTVANRSPEVCIVWTTLSAPTLILALHTFLHRISLLDQVDSTECWARAMGFVDQLLSGGLIALPFRVRSSNSTVPTSQSVYLGTYRGTLDLFDFTFSLLRLVNVSTFSSTNSHIIIGRLCQTLAVLGQRLITRLRCELHESEAQNPMISTLSQQSILVIAEIRAYIDDQDVPPSSPLKNLVASLDIVESSLSCQREDLEDTKNVPEEEEGGAVDKVPGN
nr:eri1 exoribonuclease 2 [Hymenolepis microstoma]